MAVHEDGAEGGPSPPGPAPTSTSLLRRVKAHAPEAWQRLADLYGPMVYGWCRRSGLQGEDAADIVQEVFSAVATHVAGFRGQRRQGSFRAWLRTITRNKIRDAIRRERHRLGAQGGTSAQQRLLQAPQPPDPPSQSEPPEVEDALWRRGLELVRAEFEDRSWRAFWRVAVDGRSPAEVADELGMTLHAVYKAKSRILRRLRQELSDLEPEG